MSKRAPYFLTQPLIFLPILGLGFFATYASSDSSDYPLWILWVSNLMSEWIPPIAGYSKKSDFSIVSSVYMTVGFLLMPFHFLYAYKELNNSKDQTWNKHLLKIDSWAVFIQRVFLLLVISSIVLFMIFWNPGYDFNLAPINSSRVALGVIGWAFAGGIQGALAAWIVCTLGAMYRFKKGA